MKGFVHRRPIWQVKPLGIKAVRGLAETMELETRRFYELAAAQRAIYRRANFFPILPTRNAGTSKLPRRWRERMSPPTRRKTKTKHIAGSLSCRSFSQGWRD